MSTENSDYAEIIFEGLLAKMYFFSTASIVFISLPPFTNKYIPYLDHVKIVVLFYSDFFLLTS